MTGGSAGGRGEVAERDVGCSVDSFFFALVCCLDVEICDVAESAPAGRGVLPTLFCGDGSGWLGDNFRGSCACAMMPPGDADVSALDSSKSHRQLPDAARAAPSDEVP